MNIMRCPWSFASQRAMPTKRPNKTRAEGEQDAAVRDQREENKTTEQNGQQNGEEDEFQAAGFRRISDRR